MRATGARFVVMLPCETKPLELSERFLSKKDGKRVARELIRFRSGFVAREPLSGQRTLSLRARAAVLRSVTR